MPIQIEIDWHYLRWQHAIEKTTKGVVNIYIDHIIYLSLFV